MATIKRRSFAASAMQREVTKARTAARKAWQHPIVSERPEYRVVAGECMAEARRWKAML